LLLCVIFPALFHLFPLILILVLFLNFFKALTKRRQRRRDASSVIV